MRCEPNGVEIAKLLGNGLYLAYDPVGDFVSYILGHLSVGLLWVTGVELERTGSSRPTYVAYIRPQKGWIIPPNQKLKGLTISWEIFISKWKLTAWQFS